MLLPSRLDDTMLEYLLARLQEGPDGHLYWTEQCYESYPIVRLGSSRWRASHLLVAALGLGGGAPVRIFRCETSPICLSPDHLRIIPYGQLSRCLADKHEMTPDNTITRDLPNGRVKRECRACQVARRQRHHQAWADEARAYLQSQGLDLER